MGVDVMIVSESEDIASRPGRAMNLWLERHFEDFNIRYGYVQLEGDDVAKFRELFHADPVGRMLLRKVDALTTAGESPPYTIELMIG